MHGPPQAVADAFGDSPLIAVHVDERWHDQRRSQKEQRKKEGPVFFSSRLRVGTYRFHCNLNISLWQSWPDMGYPPNAFMEIPHFIRLRRENGLNYPFSMTCGLQRRE